MVKRVSEDLKREVVAAYKSGTYTAAEIQKKYKVSSSAIYNWTNRMKDTDESHPMTKLMTPKGDYVVTVGCMAPASKNQTDKIIKINSATNEATFLTDDDLIKHALGLLASRF